MRKSLLSLALLAAVPLAQAQSELLITEAIVTPTDGEFIEIYNPGPLPVDLSDVYLTDATFSGGGTYYYNIVTGANAGGGSFGDFHARFPDGATISPGEYQTVALAGSNAFTARYGEAPTYELFDDLGDADGVPAMREALPGSINDQGGLTNSGEVAILYYWDGASDLVTDLDYFIWGDTNEGVDKTGISIDGPDADSATSTYAADTPLASQDFVTPTHSFGAAFTRTDFSEGSESGSGSNGVGGQDETSEDLTNTFATDLAPTPNEGLPAVQEITVGFATGTGTVNEDDTPNTVDIAVELTTNDGQPTDRAVSVEVNLTGGTADTGDFSDTPPSTRTVTFPVGTASGTASNATYTLNDDSDNEGTEEAQFSLTNGASPDPDMLGTDSFVLTIIDDDAPVVVPPVVINEVDADTPGGDAAEFVELYNTTGAVQTLDGLVLVVFNGSNGQSYGAVDLDGQSIDPGGRFVICFASGDISLLCDLDASALVDNGSIQNGEDAVALYTADAADFPNGTVANSTSLVDAVVYETGSDSNTDLPSLLGTGVVYDEAANGDKDNDSIQRFPDGTGSFIVDVATPGVQNIPVELAQPLAARVESGRVVLTWATASETNNAYFDVLARSAEDAEFASLGRVDGAGTTSSTQRYAFGADLAPGTYRLRLRQVDLDGTAEVVSETEVSVALDGTHRVSAVAPNPAVGEAHVVIAAARAQRVTVRVYDALGRLVATAFDADMEAQRGRRVALGTGLVPGPYVAVVTGERFREVRRFTVSR